MKDLKDMTYWELRSQIAKIIPRMTQLKRDDKVVDAVREKGFYER